MSDLSRRLNEWADVHEKSVVFMDDDPEMAEEVRAETALLREAAAHLAALEDDQARAI